MRFGQACVHGIIARLLNVLTARPLAELRRHIPGKPNECAGIVVSDRLHSTFTSMLIDCMPSSSRARLSWLT